MWQLLTRTTSRFQPHHHRLNNHPFARAADQTRSEKPRQLSNRSAKSLGKTACWSRSNGAYFVNRETIGIYGDDEKAATKKKATSKRGSGKRESMNTGRDKRFVRRDGQAKESDDVGKSLSADRRQNAKAKANPAGGRDDR